MSEWRKVDARRRDARRAEPIAAEGEQQCAVRPRVTASSMRRPVQSEGEEGPIGRHHDVTSTAPTANRPRGSRARWRHLTEDGIEVSRRRNLGFRSAAGLRGLAAEEIMTRGDREGKMPRSHSRTFGPGDEVAAKIEQDGPRSPTERKALAPDGRQCSAATACAPFDPRSAATSADSFTALHLSIAPLPRR